MFLFAGAYPDIASAEGDYEALRLLHRCDDLGSYDAAVVATRSDGKLTLHKSERRSPRGAWIGVAAGAAAAVAWPPLLPDLAAVPARALGAWMSHIADGTSQEDVSEVGELVREGRAALIVVGGVEDTRKIEQTAVEASRSTLKHLDADFDAAERESR